MGRHVLSFKSADKCFGLTEPCEPHKAQIGEWAIFESLVPHPDIEMRGKGLGNYSVTLERAVSTQAEIFDALTEVDKVATQIDVAWCYAWGAPYNVRGPSAAEWVAPQHWTGNLKEVERQIQRECGGCIVEASHVVFSRWGWRPTFPLKDALDAREPCANAPPVIAELIELHVKSHKVMDSNLLLLAKALEIVSAFFPLSRSSRNAGIESAMKQLGVDSELTQTIEWLFNIANERFDVRHAWAKGSPGVVLHPRMTPQEETDFVFNANSVIRAFVCQQLGIQLRLIKIMAGEPSRLGRWKGNELVWDSPQKSTERVR